MKTRYTLSLSDTDATLETVGGKGASLSRLANAGLPVPGGFHVTTAAYRDFVKRNDLQAGIEAALASVDVSRPQTLDAASQEIQALFVKSPIPNDIADAITQAYAALADNSPPVVSSPCLYRSRL